MDLNKSILYGQLVNEAYKVPTADLTNRAGTTVTAEHGPAFHIAKAGELIEHEVAKRRPPRPHRPASHAMRAARVRRPLVSRAQ